VRRRPGKPPSEGCVGPPLRELLSGRSSRRAIVRLRAVATHSREGRAPVPIFLPGRSGPSCRCRARGDRQFGLFLAIKSHGARSLPKYPTSQPGVGPAYCSQREVGPPLCTRSDETNLIRLGLGIIVLAGSIRDNGMNWLGQACRNQACFHAEWLVVGIGLSVAAYIAWKVRSGRPSLERMESAASAPGAADTQRRTRVHGTVRRFPCYHRGARGSLGSGFLSPSPTFDASR
jgi:hypothetical protein